jgi:cyclopropane-fatty-acyl-phospholipid synthase
VGLVSFEHSTAAYRADFVLYALAVAALAVCVAVETPTHHLPAAAGWVVAGLAAWTALEYGLHRFVLHGLQPFARWHAEHHRRPMALIGSPTLVTALLFLVLVFLPALALAGTWRASALTLGVVGGYLVYAVTHHAVHHWRARFAWLQRRKRWHALHHHAFEQPACFGVTNAFWDRHFGSMPVTVKVRPGGR